jgi:DedD protein
MKPSFAEEQAMGYTSSGTTMEDRGLRDIERWRDKIEVRLDNRQVFFLFFGSALVACMLFVLGVIVGKRLESRGRAVSPEIEDPLALLDKVATSPRPSQGGVTFPQALFGTAGKTSAADKHSKKNLPTATAGAENENESSDTKPPVEAKPTAVKSAETTTKAPAPSTAAPQGKPPAAKPESKPVVATASAAASEPSPAKTKPAESKPTEAKPPETKPAQSKPAEAKESKPAPIPTIAAGGDSKSKGRFALQLSSFQDKAEAEAFAQKFANEHPYMVVSEIPGKGTWYRVRVGDYASAKDALAAKDSFEKKHSVIAYVAQK